MVIDVHFHLLPGLDDGPRDTHGAIALARAAEAAGTTTLVATPHVSWRWQENSALRIAERVLLMNRCLRAEGIDIKVRRGAEVALTRAAELPDDELRRLRLAGGPWLLVECPAEGGGAGLETMLRRLVEQGHRLLLAHPERIPAFRERPELLERLVGPDIRCQVTAGAFVGRLGRRSQSFAGWMLERGLVHIVASDAHSSASRPPSIVPELRAAGVSEALIGWLTHEAPEALLDGHEPSRAPCFERRGRRLGRGLGRHRLHA